MGVIIFFIYWMGFVVFLFWGVGVLSLLLGVEDGIFYLFFLAWKICTRVLIYHHISHIERDIAEHAQPQNKIP